MRQKPLRAIVIDTARQEVRETVITCDSLSFMQGVVGGSVEAAHSLPNGDTLFVNEEGMLDDRPFFDYSGAHQPFAGSAVLVGMDREGETVGAKTAFPIVKAAVRFLTPNEAVARFAELG